jgi:DnaJ-class molecular chaperone
MPMPRVRCPYCKGDGARKTWTGRLRRCRVCRGTGTIR